VIRFIYDYMGRRAAKYVYDAATNGFADENACRSKTVFVYKGWTLIAEYEADTSSSSSTPNLNLKRSFTWGPDLTGGDGAGGIGGLLAIQDHRTMYEGTYNPAFDGNGNVTALVRADTGEVVAAYEYDAYGNPVRTSGYYAKENPIRFSSKYHDNETGLAYYGYRYYSPSMGRFINRDPLREDGGLNIYAMTSNNPIGRWDYLGLWELDDIPYEFRPDSPNTIDLFYEINTSITDSYSYNPDLYYSGSYGDPFSGYGSSFMSGDYSFGGYGDYYGEFISPSIDGALYTGSVYDRYTNSIDFGNTSLIDYTGQAALGFPNHYGNDCFSAAIEDIATSASGTGISRAAITAAVANAQGSTADSVNADGILLNSRWTSRIGTSGTLLVTPSGTYGYVNTAITTLAAFGVTGTAVENTVRNGATPSMINVAYNVMSTTFPAAIQTSFTGAIRNLDGTMGTGTFNHTITARYITGGTFSIGNLTGTGGYMPVSMATFISGTIMSSGSVQYIIQPQYPTIIPTNTISWP
jgi:RHS repeat-associated protein